MPRSKREDYPGAWHHVVNRGVAKRPLFEAVRDVRYFLACLARQVRRGRIEVHAYAVLTTHFHLLVRSPRGELSSAMQHCQDAYSRWFNRGRKRDGPLFRGRFKNRIIEDDPYWDSVLRYIDHNPVSAGLARTPWEYPFGSAYHYSRDSSPPPWLATAEVQNWVGGSMTAPFSPGDYRRFCSATLSPGREWVVEKGLSLGRTEDLPPEAGLLDRTAADGRSWLAFKANLADGRTRGAPLVSPEAVAAAMAVRHDSGVPSGPGTRQDLGHWHEALLAGVLRTASGESIQSIGDRLGLGETTTRRRLALFRRALATDTDFLLSAENLFRDALEREGRGSLPDGNRSRIPVPRIQGASVAATLGGTPPPGGGGSGSGTVYPF